MSYDRVDCSDKAHFSSPSDEYNYSDEPIRNGPRSANGNGIYRIYNDYTVELKPKPHSNSMKIICFEWKNTKRVKLIMLGALLVFCLSLVLIIVSATAYHKQQVNKPVSSKYETKLDETYRSNLFEVPGNKLEPRDRNMNGGGIVPYIKTNIPTQRRKDLEAKDTENITKEIPHVKSTKAGLFAYGPDAKGLISFSPEDHMTYMDYFNRLESGLADYSTLRQAANLDKYIPCNDSTTSVPDGKVCMLTLDKFGENCQHFELYGIREERPCVLLVLKPDDSLTPEPFDFSGDKNAEIKKKIGDRYSNNSIAVSCEGKTEDDQAFLTRFNDTKVVDYNPPKGFPLYYYLQRHTDGYLYPAVMVQFNTVPAKTQVNVKCTAWAKNFNNGEPQNSPKYTTEFGILLN